MGKLFNPFCILVSKSIIMSTTYSNDNRNNKLIRKVLVHELCNKMKIFPKINVIPIDNHKQKP